MGDVGTRGATTMHVINQRQSEREPHELHAGSEELAARIARIVRENGTVEPLPGLYLHRASSPSGLTYGESFPSLCLVAQGSKELLLADTRYHYDPAHYLISSVPLPIATWITEASPERPYLGLVLRLGQDLVGSVLVEAGQRAAQSQAAVTAINVSRLDAELLDAVVRLVRLLDSPRDTRFLAPLVIREIVYRLLKGAQGDRLQQIASMGGTTHRIAEAIEWLRKDFDQPLRIEEIARALGMSVSGFHHHFRSVTAMTPLQYQKQLRLQEARRLMVGKGIDAASAGYRVGYRDASHFTREYKRLFGEPPMRDVERLRETTTERAAQYQDKQSAVGCCRRIGCQRQCEQFHSGSG